MERIKTTVRQNADNAHAARELAKAPSHNAHNGGEVMQSTGADHGADHPPARARLPTLTA